MQDELVDKLVRNLTEAMLSDLRRYAAEQELEEFDFENHFLTVETRTTNGKVAVLFTYSDPAYLPKFPQTKVSDVIAEPTFRLVDALLNKIGKSFSGFQIAIRNTQSQSWQTSFRLLPSPSQGFEDVPRLYMRLTGFGISANPIMPTIYRAVLTSKPPRLIYSCRPQFPGPDGNPHSELRAQLDFQTDGFELRLAGTDDVNSVFEVSEGPALENWKIESARFSCAVPEGMDVRAPLASGTCFDLLGPEDCLVCVHGPLNEGTESIDNIALPDQHELERGTTTGGDEWIVICYEHDQKEYRQIWIVKNVGKQQFLIQGQFEPAQQELVKEAAFTVAGSLTPSNLD